MATPILRYTLIFIQDPVDMGYTAFLAEYPDTLAEGDTKEEARGKLFELLDFIGDYKKQKSLEKIGNQFANYEMEEFNAELEPA